MILLFPVISSRLFYIPICSIARLAASASNFVPAPDTGHGGTLILVYPLPMPLRPWPDVWPPRIIGIPDQQMTSEKPSYYKQHYMCQRQNTPEATVRCFSSLFWKRFWLVLMSANPFNPQQAQFLLLWICQYPPHFCPFGMPSVLPCTEYQLSILGCSAPRCNVPSISSLLGCSALSCKVPSIELFCSLWHTVPSLSSLMLSSLNSGRVLEHMFSVTGVGAYT
jgi:hypothetical protein